MYFSIYNDFLVCLICQWLRGVLNTISVTLVDLPSSYRSVTFCFYMEHIIEFLKFQICLAVLSFICRHESIYIHWKCWYVYNYFSVLLYTSGLFYFRFFLLLFGLILDFFFFTPFLSAISYECIICSMLILLVVRLTGLINIVNKVQI